MNRETCHRHNTSIQTTQVQNISWVTVANSTWLSNIMIANEFATLWKESLTSLRLSKKSSKSFNFSNRVCNPEEMSVFVLIYSLLTYAWLPWVQTLDLKETTLTGAWAGARVAVPLKNLNHEKKTLESAWESQSRGCTSNLETNLNREEKTRTNAYVS